MPTGDILSKGKKRVVRHWLAPRMVKIPHTETVELVLKLKQLEEENCKLMHEVIALRSVFDATSSDGTMMGPRLYEAVQKAVHYLKNPVDPNLNPAPYRKMILYYTDWAARNNCPKTFVYRAFKTEERQVRFWRESIDTDESGWRPVRQEANPEIVELLEGAPRQLAEHEKQQDVRREYDRQNAKPSSFDEMVLGHYRNLDEDLDVDE